MILFSESSIHCPSQTIRAGELKFERMFAPHQVSHIMCCMSGARWSFLGALSSSRSQVVSPSVGPSPLWKSDLKGTVTQNIFFLKSGPNGCIDLWNNIDLQTNIDKRKENQVSRYFVPWNYVHRAKSALLHNFAGQSMKALWFCGAKYEGSVILRGKVCIAP